MANEHSGARLSTSFSILVTQRRLHHCRRSELPSCCCCCCCSRSIGQRSNHESLWGLRLGTNLFTPHKCPCGLHGWCQRFHAQPLSCLLAFGRATVINFWTTSTSTTWHLRALKCSNSSHESSVRRDSVRLQTSWLPDFNPQAERQTADNLRRDAFRVLSPFHIPIGYTTHHMAGAAELSVSRKQRRTSWLPTFIRHPSASRSRNLWSY